jgi:hypothetical protein
MQGNNPNNNITSYPELSHNMATATNGFREFYERAEEDATLWLRDILMITSLSGFFGK